MSYNYILKKRVLESASLVIRKIYFFVILSSTHVKNEKTFIFVPKRRFWLKVERCSTLGGYPLKICCDVLVNMCTNYEKNIIYLSDGSVTTKMMILVPSNPKKLRFPWFSNSKAKCHQKSNIVRNLGVTHEKFLGMF